MNALIILISTLISLYMWAIIIRVILGWLIQFNVVNSRSPFVYMAGNFLHRVTEPVLFRIRRLLPDMGGLDVSPILAILLLIFLQNLLLYDIAPALL